ncbi:MAG: YeeE/YedE family protein [Lautropia sp.]
MDNEQLISPLVITGLGFLIGFVFGYVGNKTNFCTMGAVSDIVNMGNWTRMRMWTLAIGVAVLGVGLLQSAGLVDVSKSIYTTTSIPWLSHVVGGVTFGIGMSLASGCTSKTLIRIGGGNLKSLVVFFVLGISAYITLKGLFGVWRASALDPVAIPLATTQDLPSVVAAAWGLDAAIAATWIPVLLGAGLIVFSLAHEEARTRDALVGGTVVGLLVVAAWYVTGHVAFVAEHPETLEAAYIATGGNRPESLSLVAPFAQSLELLMFWSDANRHLTFGIASAIGIVLGSLVYALASRTYREESFPDASDLKRHILGAVLMGFGGITAMGCTIGQGLSGVSTLSIGSFITLASIVAGSAAMMKVDYWQLMRAEA